MAAEAKRVIYAAIAANVSIAVAKFIAAGVTGSTAMLSEGIHSMVDSGDGVLLLVGEHRGRKPPDAHHPYGHGREVYFWAFVVAVMIFTLGGGITIYDGIVRLLHPHEIKKPIWNFVVLGLAFLFEGTSFTMAVRHVLKRKPEDLSIAAFVRQSKNPSDFMILLEDLAALLGIVIAAAGVGLQLWTSNPRFDGGASIVIGLLLLTVAIILGVETRSLLLGESVSRETAEGIRLTVENDAAVERSAYPLATHFGPETVLVNIGIRFRPGLQTGELEQAIDRIERAISRRYPIVKRVFIAVDSLEEQGEHQP